MLRELQSVEFAHDLKVPLQLITSCVQLLEEEIHTNARAEGYLRTLARSADQLQTMVRRALEEDAQPGVRNIMKDAKDIAHEFDILARRKGIHVQFSANASQFCMRIDGEKLRRILRNLLSNALRFTPCGGRIRLDVQLMGDSVEFSVSDTGCGIPEKDQPRVFERGFSADSTGHGLIISKKYAEIMGGSLKMESWQGVGSRFTLRIPV